MKVIDLLNKIAKSEEVPKKIKIDNKILNLDNGKEIKYRFENSCGALNWNYYIDLKRLNDEIEIIEEPKKIEMLPILKDGEIFQTNLAINQTRRKLNEVIYYINDKENK